MMSHHVARTLALASAVALAGLAGAACGGAGDGSGAAASRANANANQVEGGAGRPATTPGGAAAASAGEQRIEMGDDVFQPALLTVPAGTKVIWVNKGQKAHTVVSNDKLFDSGLVNVGGEFSHTFASPGTYSYHCAPHVKMIGRIVVQ